MSNIENPLGFFDQNNGGWEGLTPGQSEASQDELDRQEQEEHDLDVHIQKTFNTTSGKIVLKFLRERTIESATWCASLGLENGTAHGFAREGQNALVRDIELRIKRAEDYKKDANRKEI